MNKFKKILIGMIALTLIFVIGFVGTLLWLQSKAQNTKKEANSVKKSKTVVHKIEAPIISNLKDNGKVNISVTVELAVKDETKDDKKFSTDLAADDSLVNTTIIVVLRSKTVADVSEPDAPIKIGKEITDELNKAYNCDKFVTTNYKQFITQ